ncbi:MAG: 4Fe-4S binding protein, partial [Kiritimatiellae bacterium]|nr:4Fe-4S binding protein [Kiritimatiellia bacterium]
MQSPVFTVENECQDCYKCVRHCHPKAIRIENGHAAVIAGSCVACGECVRVCPARAKRIRRDVDRLPRLLESGRPVYASVAPSFVAAFPDWTLGQLAAALRSLGFAGVSETAHGAQIVSAAT